MTAQREFELKARLKNMSEFNEGAIEFVKSISECPSCAIKFALELVDSADEQERKVLKQILYGLAESITKQESRDSVPRNFPFIRAWLKGEIGLGIIPRILGGLSEV